jgi:hypothetical protein
VVVAVRVDEAAQRAGGDGDSGAGMMTSYEFLVLSFELMGSLRERPSVQNQGVREAHTTTQNSTLNTQHF